MNLLLFVFNDDDFPKKEFVIHDIIFGIIGIDN